MKEFYLSICIGLFLGISVPNLKGQECKDFKYLGAILKLETNPKINKEIKRIFKKELKKQKNKGKFNVSNQIDYLSLYKTFSRKLDSTFIIHNNSSYSEKELQEKYDKQERFESYKSKCLASLISFRNTTLELRFSKPKESYLVAELLDKRINQGQIKHGKAMQFLFLFDESGVIIKVYSTARIYN